MWRAILLSIWLGLLSGSVINAVLGWIDARYPHNAESLVEARAFRVQISGAGMLVAITVSLMVML